ncbi:MAG: glycosyltransferase family 39 protein [Anaerolineales bacterium]|nr:glycosyltransferase family 39 protein [Anaerolineales bacterium]
MTNFSLSRIQSTPWLWRLILIGLLALGLLLRLVDLTDEPLDFHSTRQLRNVLVARGIYYELLQSTTDQPKAELAASFQRTVGQYEPPVIESLVGWTYIWTGGEHPWIARIYNALFWVLAGIAIFDLARRMASIEAGLASLAYYLILPFSVQASRSFQPDPLMTAAFILGIYCLYRWSETQTWKWAILTGLLTGMATLIKIVIAFLIGGAAVAIVLYTLGRRFWKSPQVWAITILMITPALGYYVIRDPGRSSEYFFAWTVDLIKLVTTTQFYSSWLGFLGSLFGLGILFVSLAGMLVAPSRGRLLLLGLWTGYLGYGLTLPFQMYTHSYYHLQLIPVAALGLAPAIRPFFEFAAQQERFWRFAFIGLAIAVLGYQSWVARSILVAEDFRHEPAVWTEIGQAIPPDAKVIGLTQDYGYRLMVYGWRKISIWPLSTQLKEIRGGSLDAENKFNDLTEGKEYFLVTAFGQLDKQPVLEKILDEYPIAAEGEGYILYDLQPWE